MKPYMKCCILSTSTCNIHVHACLYTVQSYLMRVIEEIVYIYTCAYMCMYCSRACFKSVKNHNRTEFGRKVGCILLLRIKCYNTLFVFSLQHRLSVMAQDIIVFIQFYFILFHLLKMSEGIDRNKFFQGSEEQI